MPYNPPEKASAGEARNFFGATCHVGPDAAFAGELRSLNDYMAAVSTFLREGRPYAGVGAYLPLEDQWVRHVLPEEQMRPSAHYHFELQHVRFPEALRGHQPCWISMSFLPECTVEDGNIRCRELSVPALCVDCDWLDHEALAELLRLAQAGATIVLRGSPREPGYVRHDEDYAANLSALQALAREELDVPALVSGEDLPEFRATETEAGLNLFFAHPCSHTVAYPLHYGQGLCEGVEEHRVTVHAFGREIPITLRFEPNQSLLFRISRAGEVEPVDVHYTPPVPEVRPPFPKDHRYPGYCLA
jgi:hypothetical protein